MSLNITQLLSAFYCVANNCTEWTDLLASIDKKYNPPGHNYVTSYDILYALGCNQLNTGGKLRGHSCIVIDRTDAIKIVNALFDDVNWNNIFALTGVSTNYKQVLKALGIAESEITIKDLIPDMGN